MAIYLTRNVDGVVKKYKVSGGGSYYPIGSIYMSTENTSPASLFGGTWEQIKDKFLLSAGDTYSAGSSGGEATHMITSKEMARLELSFCDTAGTAGVHKGSIIGNSIYTYGVNKGFIEMNRANIQEPLSLMPPYLVVYCWKRIS